MEKRTGLRPSRVFSETLKKKIVSEIEKSHVSVAAVQREYSVSSTSVYKWLNKYSRHLHSGTTTVIQMESESYKSKELAKRVLELEAALGRKQIEIDFLNRMIEQGKQELGVDLKKKFITPPFNGSDSTKEPTDTK